MSKLTLGVGIIVSGEGPFLEHSVRAIRPYADVIAIVEGADHRWIDLGNANPDGSSKDNTTEVIQKLVSESGTPIKAFAPAVYANRNRQRQVYLDYFLEQGVDVCLVLDADEFYFPKHVERMLRFFERNPNDVGVKYDFWNFYSWVRRYHKTIEMERCFRLQPGMHYFDKDGGQSVVDKQGQGIWRHFVRDDHIKCYHYNRVLSGRDLVSKIRFYMERDGNATRETKLKPGNIGADALTAICKNPNNGKFVPLAAQPPGARSLIYSSVSQHTSWASALDMAGMFAPLSLSDMVKAAEEFADIDFFTEKDLLNFELAYGAYLKSGGKVTGLNHEANNIAFESSLFKSDKPVASPTGSDRFLLGSATFDRKGWERLPEDAFLSDAPEAGQASALVVEHHVEKLSCEELDKWIRNVRIFLRNGGYVRFAVPDPNSSEIKAKLKAPFTSMPEFAAYLHSNGFKAEPLEYHTDEGELVSREWSEVDGFIYRSSKGSGGLKSVVMDAFKLV